MNNYHLYAELGRGRGSTVYKGREKKTLQYVAVKSVDKSLKRRVLTEVSVLYALRGQPNILQFINWYETSKHIWLLVQYCPGGDLMQLLRADHSLPEYSIQRLAADICTGLIAVHSRGFVYADLKPSNILIDEYGQMILADFGLARRVAQMPESSADAEQNQQQQAQQSPKRGSPYYMSPELFYSDGICSFASDLWALGVVLYELARGRPPFYAKELEQVVRNICEEEPEPLQQAPPFDATQSDDADGDDSSALDTDALAPQRACADNPHGHSYSFSFLHFISRCLEKDPARRMSWDELREHAWWRQAPRGLGVRGSATLDPSWRLEKVELPPEPLFDKLFRSSQQQEQASPQQSARGNGSATSLSGTLRSSSNGGSGPDIMRLSFQAAKNRQLEAEMAAAARAASTAAAQQRGRRKGGVSRAQEEEDEAELPTRSPQASQRQQNQAAAIPDAHIAKRPSPTPSEEVEEELYAEEGFDDGDAQAQKPQQHGLTMPSADTELDFSMEGPAGEELIEDETIPALPPPAASSSAASTAAAAAAHTTAASSTNAAVRPASSSQQQRTFREPIRPAQPSALDVMEEEFARLKQREEDSEAEEEDEEQLDEEHQQQEDEYEEQHHQHANEPGTSSADMDEQWRREEAAYQEQQQRARRQQQQQQQHQSQRQQQQQQQQHRAASPSYDDDEDSYEDAAQLNPPRRVSSMSAHHAAHEADEYNDDDEIEESLIHADPDAELADADTSTEPSSSNHHRSTAATTQQQQSRSNKGSKLPVLASRATATVAAASKSKSAVSGSLKPASRTASSSSSSSSTAASRSIKSHAPAPSTPAAGSRKSAPAGSASSSSTSAGVSAPQTNRSAKKSVSNSPAKPPATAQGTRSTKPSAAASSSSIKRPVSHASQRPAPSAESSAAAARRAAAAVTRAAAVDQHDPEYGRLAYDSQASAAYEYGQHDAVQPQPSPFAQHRQHAWQEQQQQQHQQQHSSRR